MVRVGSATVLVRLAPWTVTFDVRVTLETRSSAASFTPLLRLDAVMVAVLVYTTVPQSGRG